MKVAAVISEFNPFHNGHKYLVDTIKSNYADAVVAIMSGNFVQRGDVAITDKYKRAECALNNGCDLVVELPTVFAVSGAQTFAKGGVDIAKATNADMLCFCAENDNIDTLVKVADIFENEDFCNKLKFYINNGEYYPKAVSMAASDIIGHEYSEILNTPNNTLAVEYIKALKDSRISPVAIKRTGTQHDSFVTTDTIASATHIRNLVFNSEQYKCFTPIKIDNPANIQKLETTILYKLRTMTKAELSDLPDVEEGLHNRIYECARSSNSLEELYTSLKTKRYTLARLRRIIVCALLDIKKDNQAGHAEYIRVLAMNNVGADIIRKSTLPVIAKVRQDYHKLSDTAKKQFDIDVRSSEIYSLALNTIEGFSNDFSSKIIKA